MALSHLQNLSVTCIVGNVNRGIDERNVSFLASLFIFYSVIQSQANRIQAHELLEKITKRNFQLDGMYNPEALCFILSQNDNADFKTNAHLAANPKLKRLCSPAIEQLAKLNASVAKLTKDEKVAKREYMKCKKVVKDLEKELRALKKGAVEAPTANPRPRKRDRNGAFGKAPSEISFIILIFF